MIKFEVVGYDFCPFIQPVIVTLKEKGAAFTVTYIESGEMPGWVRQVSPEGMTPFLLADGKVLFESAAINEFVNEATSGDLHPRDAFLKAQNRMWISRSYGLLDHIYELKTTDSQDIFHAERMKLRTKLRALDEAIGENTFFNGADFCLIDGAFAPVFRSIALLDGQFAAGILDALPNVARWSMNILDRPSVRTSVVESFDTRLAEKILSSHAIAARLHSSSAAASAVF